MSDPAGQSAQPGAAASQGGTPPVTERAHIFLRDLRPNAYIDGVYTLVNPQLGTARNGKHYFKALLRDSSGECALRMWTFEEAAMPEVTRTGFVWLSGQTQNYNGQVQIVAEVIRAAEVDTHDLTRLLPATTKNIDSMFEEVSRILRSMRHPAMVALAEQYLANDALVAGFKRAPAAVSVHHAYLGGLLEHTLQLLHLAELMLPLYPGLNRDLVLMGLFLHDLAKTVELEWERGFSYTPDGNLVGHSVRGAIWLQAFASAAGRERGHRLPPEALRVLQHIVISHHGELEFGAAKVPSTPEAMFVAMLDNLDAKTAVALDAAQRDRGDAHLPGHEFTEKIWSLETRIYRPDPLAEPPEEPAAPADGSGA